MERTTILYDADCGFCRWSMDKLLKWDRRRLLRPVALQDSEADRLLGSMPEEGKMASWHLVTPEGRVISGGTAAGPILRLLPGGRPFAAVVSAFPGLTERTYRWVSQHRDLMARVVGTRACAVDPKRTEERRAAPGQTELPTRKTKER